MEKFVYVSCLGNVYLSNDPDCDWEPCDICGDHDRLIGTADNPLDLAKVMLEESFTEEYILEKTGYEIGENGEYKKVKDVKWLIES